MARMPGAEWRPLSINFRRGGNRPRIVILHIIVGTLAGADSWFRNPASRVSAHFGTSRAGALRQWVDTADVAWANQGANSYSISIENEGQVGDALTPAQIERCAQVLAWANPTHGVEIRVNNSVSGSGLSHHNMSSTWGVTACPGSRIVAQRAQIVARAQQIRSGGGAAPSPSPSPGSSNPYGARATDSVQEVVNALGYMPPLKVDDDYGALTLAGVEWVQRNRFGFAGPDVDGKWGGGTEAAYQEYLKRTEDDMPDRNLYATTTGYVQPIPRGEWVTLRFDRIFRNGAWETKTPEPSFVFGPSFYSASVGIRVVGLERGQEFQVRLAYYREAAGGGWERYATMPIDSPVHDAGSGHFTTSWNGHVSGSSKGRVRVEVIHYGPETQTVAVDFARAEALVWSG